MWRPETHQSGTNMTGRLGDRTMEMSGGSTASYLERTLCIPVFSSISIGLEAKGLLDFRHGITSVVRWNLRSATFGVESNSPKQSRAKSWEIAFLQWNPKYGCKGTVTTRFALIALVAWQY